MELPASILFRKFRRAGARWYLPWRYGRWRGVNDKPERASNLKRVRATARAVERREFCEKRDRTRSIATTNNPAASTYQPGRMSYVKSKAVLRITQGETR